MSKNKVTFAMILVVCIAVAVANYLVFMVVPNEQVMGAVQRIFYFHVGSAFASYFAVGTMLVAALNYLATRNKRADVLQASAAEVGFVFCTITLISGMIWGHAAWNTAFSWREPRLVSFLCFWLILLGFSMLRRFGDTEKLPEHSAVLSILGAITVPIVVYSVKFLPHVGQLHPVVVENRGLQDPMYRVAFVFCSITLIALQFVLVWIRYRAGLIEQEVKMREIV